MLLTLLKSKLHRASVTDADLNYDGSITIDKKLCEAACIENFEKVDIYNINNGKRFSTYVIYGKRGEICLNGAAARLVQKNDRVIIVSYFFIEKEKAKTYKPKIVRLDRNNKVKD